MKTKIKTVEDAFKYTDRDIAVLEAFKLLPEQDRDHQEADYTSKVIIEALNKEDNGGKTWTPDWEDGKYNKFFTWAWLKRNPNGVGFVVGGTDYGGTCAHTGVGSRLCFRNPDHVMYFNKQFGPILQKRIAE